MAQGAGQFDEYQALVRRLESERRERHDAQRSLMQRMADMHETLSAGNSEIWRTQRDGLRALDERLDHLEGVIARALGRVSRLSGGLEAAENANRQQTDHLSRIDVALGTVVGRLDEMRRGPRIKSATWGAVGAPLALIVFGLVSWGLKRLNIDVGWP
jgi:chromosome segregation ATPase